MATEKRLIDAYALTDVIEGIDWYHIDKMGYLVHGANSDENIPLYKAVSIFRAIKEAPTVDAVEVVRCKNCKHCATASWGEKFCKRKQADGVYAELSNLREEDFCSFGERREGE